MLHGLPRIMHIIFTGITFLLIFGNLPDGGCGGQGCYNLTKPKGHKLNGVALGTSGEPQKFSTSSELVQILIYFITLCSGRPCKRLDNPKVPNIFHTASE